MQIPLIKGSAVIIPVTCLDKDGNPVVLSAAVDKVLYTIRETETAEAFLLQKWGYIEYRGDADNGAVVSVELMPEDYKDPDVPVGTWWYDFWVRELGTWFDFDPDRYNDDLYFPFHYGAVRVSENGVEWIDVEPGFIGLDDDDFNFVQVTSAGVVLTDDAYQEGNRKLFRVITLDGKILEDWPRADWFTYDLNEPYLEFDVAAGFVIDWEANALLSVDPATINLEDDAINYVQVNPLTQEIVSNIRGWESGKKNLYKVTVKDGKAAVEKQPTETAIKDDRTIYTRGDRFFAVAKDRINVLASISNIEGAFEPDEDLS